MVIAVRSYQVVFRLTLILVDLRPLVHSLIMSTLVSTRKRRFVSICDKLRENDSSTTTLDLCAYRTMDWDEAELLCDALDTTY